MQSSRAAASGLLNFIAMLAYDPGLGVASRDHPSGKYRLGSLRTLNPARSESDKLPQRYLGQISID
jgi:hypothetical protein